MTKQQIEQNGLTEFIATPGDVHQNTQIGDYKALYNCTCILYCDCNVLSDYSEILIKWEQL